MTAVIDRRVSSSLLYVADAVVWLCALFFARLSRFKFDLDSVNWKATVGFAIGAAILQILFGTLLELYRGAKKRRNTSISDAGALAIVVFSVGAVLTAAAFFLGKTLPVAPSVVAIAIPIALIFMFLLRSLPWVFNNRNGSLGGVSTETPLAEEQALVRHPQMSRSWENRYGRKLLATDIAIVLTSVFVAQFLRFGLESQDIQLAPIARQWTPVQYTLVSVTLAFIWLIALETGRTRDPRVFGLGPTEYKRVVNTTLFAFGLFAILAFATRAEVARGYVLLALPLGLVLLLISRWLWRKRLHHQRAKGRNTYRTLIVAERRKTIHVAKEIARSQYAGFDLVGAVTERGTNKDLLPGLPVVASYDSMIEAVDNLKVDTVIVTSADDISPQRLRTLGWQLQERGVDLVLTAALTDIAGPRIHLRPVSGLPLIYVEHPEFSGRKLIEKRAFDLLVSGLLLLILSPVLVVLAVLVRTTSPGPAFFKQTRVGWNGEDFSMLKFRSMVVDAEQQLTSILDASDGNGVLFKMKHDPRVTKVGTVLRRYSLDELPQLINVFRGEMSLVGPRPPLPSEVETYEDSVRRRLLVKPGITGLWQVSGRSDLSWEDSVRLDLYYVENWSMVGDLQILLRTARAVLSSAGAY